MILSINFSEKYPSNNIKEEYVMLYDSNYISEKQAKAEIKARNIGGFNPNLRPYFLIYSKEKEHIIQALVDAVKEETLSKFVKNS